MGAMGKIQFVGGETGIAEGISFVLQTQFPSFFLF